MLIHRHRARVSARESWPLAVCCTAIGFEALRDDTTGAQNTAVGDGALHDNTNGNFNTAVGLAALAENQTGDSNTAIGWGALSENTGNSNTAAGLEKDTLRNIAKNCAKTVC